VIKESIIYVRFLNYKLQLIIQVNCNGSLQLTAANLESRHGKWLNHQLWVSTANKYTVAAKHEQMVKNNSQCPATAAYLIQESHINKKIRAGTGDNCIHQST